VKSGSNQPVLNDYGYVIVLAQGNK